MRKHLLQDCIYVKCPDCSEVVLKAHKYKHIYQNKCPSQQKKCFYCQIVGNAKDIDEHEMKCPKRKVPCPYLCGNLTILHDELEKHEQMDCPMRPVQCARCHNTYTDEEFNLHHCIPSQQTPADVNRSLKQQALKQQVGITMPMQVEADISQGVVPQKLTSKTSSSNTTASSLFITNFSKYLTSNDDKSKTEVFQRLVVSYIIICLMSLIAYHRNQRKTDIAFEHDMEIPSMFLWSIFTSALVFLSVLGGSSCYKNYFKAINTKEWISILLAINFVHLVRFYSNKCISVIVGSLCGSTLEVFLFARYTEMNPGQFTNAVWIMTQFVTVILVPFILMYYNSISAKFLATMQLVYVTYIVILKEKQWIKQRWEGMTQENRATCLYLINGTILFSIAAYFISAMSHEMIKVNYDSIQIMLIAILPIAYLFVLAKEGVQDLMINFAIKLYNSSIYSFWGRACMVAIIYYTMTFCLIIPIVQETGDFTVGSALASILIVYSLIVQTGLLSKYGLQQALNESMAISDKAETWYRYKIIEDYSIFLNLRFEEIVVNHYITSPDISTLKIYIEPENTDDISRPDYGLNFTVSLSVINNKWWSSNEIITFSLEDISGQIQNPKLGTACMVLHDWEKYITDGDTITIEVELTQDAQ